MHFLGNKDLKYLNDGQNNERECKSALFFTKKTEKGAKEKNNTQIRTIVLTKLLEAL